MQIEYLNIDTDKIKTCLISNKYFYEKYFFLQKTAKNKIRLLIKRANNKC